MAPPLDVVRYVRDARARQRRGRITLVALATATAAVVIGTTAASDLLFASSGRGEVAHPSVVPPQVETVPSRTPSSASEGEDARIAQRWTDVLDERAERDVRLGAVADGLRSALQGRPRVLSLVAPERFGRCPNWTPALNSSLQTLSEQRGPVGDGPSCLWSGFPENEELLVQLEYATGTNRERMVQDVASEVNAMDCYPTALPGTAVFSALALCEEDARITWRLHAEGRRADKDPPRTRQSPLILAAFRPWGGSQDDATRGVWRPL